ncbi:MAG: hypothetical protein ACM3UL_00235 [Ignavibacteria bacterium]
MTSNKPQPNQQSKPIHINLDVFPEDNQLLNNIQTEQKLNSKKDAFHVICSKYRGECDLHQLTICKYRFANFCLREVKEVTKLKNVTQLQCQACLTAQQLKQEDNQIWRETHDDDYIRERSFFKRLGVPVDEYHDSLSWRVSAEQIFQRKDEQIAELKKPNAERLSEIEQLKIEAQKVAPLEADNAFLREQVEKLSKDPIIEKNAWLTTQLGKKDEENKRLKAELEQKDTVIRAYMFQQQGMKK